MKRIIIEKQTQLNIWKILYYFLIYSFIGFLIETTFGLITKGVLESRQSLLIGPFCFIYGISATLIIIFFNKYKNNIIKLFIGSIIICGLAEYLMSYICETLYSFKWWDYSHLFLNINGRICLIYCIFWGILGVFLIKQINPLFTKIYYIFNKNYKLCNSILLGIITFLFVDMYISNISLNMFSKKIANEFNIDTSNNTSYTYFEQIANKVIDVSALVKIYPNMQIVDKNNNSILISTLYPNTINYYYKIR
ncbi:MAG: hypothetical protein E7311_00135 [Clostridiales bacterium]|nr:hypothetical protein [Clostridiales bacterium]